MVDMTGCEAMSFSDVSPVTATGYVVVPPAAGVAEFGGMLGDGLLFPLVQAAVQAGGQFTVALPGVPGRLPAAGNVGVLPYLPSAAQCGIAGVPAVPVRRSPVASEVGAGAVRAGAAVVVRLWWWGCAGAAGQLPRGWADHRATAARADSVGGDPGQTRIFSYLLCPEKQIGGAIYFSEWYDWRAEL